MNILVVNPIVYTSETKNITRTDSIKDTMIYDLCLAFTQLGHKVTLFAGEPFKPVNNEEYPFIVIWGKCAFQKVFLPHCIPYMPSLVKYIKDNKSNIDLIISSEVFSINSLNAVLFGGKKVVIWHELAKHNAIFKKLPSKIWYNLVARIFMRNTTVVARSYEAKKFIEKYCKNTQDYVIDHGVNLDKFKASKEKENYFVVCSQLIQRKRIDLILNEFSNYLNSFDTTAKLYIIGDGELKDNLKSQCENLQISDNVVFTGKINHEELLPYLSRAKALLIKTEKDNNMISIIESIAVGTPILTTEVPLNSTYIKKYKLGIAKDWDKNDLKEIVDNNNVYIKNCLEYRKKLSTLSKAEEFTKIIR